MIYFVSGHRDLTKEEFEEHYVPLIQKVIKEDSWAEFVVGDWEGCDIMFVEYMLIHSFRFTLIKVFGVKQPKMKPFGSHLLSYDKISFRNRDTYDKCDISMTFLSDFDIAWIRPGREDSHTAKNIKRRYGLK